MKIEEKHCFSTKQFTIQNVNKIAILASQVTKLEIIHRSKNLRSKLIEQCLNQHPGKTN